MQTRVWESPWSTWRFPAWLVGAAALRAPFSTNGPSDKPVRFSSIRRECLDHVIILSPRHLRRILPAYLTYYDRSRTRLALDKDAPDRWPASSGAGPIVVTPEVGGLHHRYDRQAARALDAKHLAMDTPGVSCVRPAHFRVQKSNSCASRECARR